MKYKVTNPATEFNTEAEKCAFEFILFCMKHECWIDTCVYVNGKRYGCCDLNGHYKYDNNWNCVFCETEMNPKDYFHYAGNFMSVSTEGPLYDFINYNYPSEYCEPIVEELNDLFKRYNKYYELGNAWNFSLYNI